MDDREDAAIFKAVHDAKKRSEPALPVPLRRDAVTEILSGGALPGRPAQSINNRPRSKHVRPRTNSELLDGATRAPRRLPHSVTSKQTSRALATHSSIIDQLNETPPTPPRKPIELSPTTVAASHHTSPVSSKQKMRREYPISNSVFVSVTKGVSTTRGRGPTTMRKSVRNTPIYCRSPSSKRDESATNTNSKNNNEKATTRIARKSVASSRTHGDRMPPRKGVHEKTTTSTALPSSKPDVVLVLDSSDDDKMSRRNKGIKYRGDEVRNAEPSLKESDNENIDLTRNERVNKPVTLPRNNSQDQIEPSNPYSTIGDEKQNSNLLSPDLSSHRDNVLPPSSPQRQQEQEKNQRSPSPPRYQDVIGTPQQDSNLSPRPQSPKSSAVNKTIYSPTSSKPPPTRDEKSKRRSDAPPAHSSDDSSSSSSSGSSSSSSRYAPQENAKTYSTVNTGQTEEEKNKEKQRRTYLKEMNNLVKSHLEVVLDSGYKRSVLVLEYIEEADIHFVRFLDERGGSERINLTIREWRKLTEEEVAELKETLGARTEHDPARAARTRIQPKRRRPPARKGNSQGDNGSGSKVKRRRSTVEAIKDDGTLGNMDIPGGELIGATIAIRWPGNGEMFVALVVGCQEEQFGRTKHKIFYVVDQSTEVIDLTTRHWMRNGPGCEDWDTSGLVGRRVVVLWEGVYDGEAEDTPLRPIPYEAFVVKYIENFRYRLLYTQGDSLEDRDMDKNTDTWELCDPGVWTFDGLPLVSWTNVQGDEADAERGGSGGGRV